MVSDTEDESVLMDSDLEKSGNEVTDHPEKKGSSKNAKAGEKTQPKKPTSSTQGATEKGLQTSKGSGKRKEGHASMGENISEVREKLGFSDEKEWLEWLRGPSFKPFWQTLWNGWLKDHRPASGKRGLGLDEVLEIQEVYKGDFWGVPDTTNWKEGQHLAYFMFLCVNRNKQHDDGVFKNRPLRPKEAEMLIWAVLKIVQHLHAPSQIHKPSGGYALMGNGQPSNNTTAYQDSTPRSKKNPKKDDKNGESSDAEGDDVRFDFSQPGAL